MDLGGELSCFIDRIAYNFRMTYMYIKLAISRDD